MQTSDQEYHEHNPTRIYPTNDWAYEHFKKTLPNEDIVKVIEHEYFLCECGLEYFDVLYAASQKSMKRIISIDGEIKEQKNYCKPGTVVAVELIKRGFLTSLYLTLSATFGIAYYVNNDDALSLGVSMFFGYATAKEIINSVEIEKLRLDQKELWEKYEKALLEK